MRRWNVLRYLQSLYWWELRFSPGIYPILSLPDYLRRKSKDGIGTAQVDEDYGCDIAKCMLVQLKLCATNHYSVALAGGKLLCELYTQDCL